jgi:hypothetical protein
MHTAMIHTKCFSLPLHGRWRPHDQFFCQSGWPDDSFMTKIQSETVKELIPFVCHPLLRKDGRRVAYIDASNAPLPYLWRESVEHIVHPAQMP